jgi:diguanylate cyclase (GGDEF)-like protein/PAS domain S-box-containing protein
LLSKAIKSEFLNNLLEKEPTMEEHLLDFLMDNIPDNVYFKDIESRFIKTSKTQAEALGVSDPAQLVGKSDFDFYPEENARLFYEDEQSIIQTGNSVSKEEMQIWPGRPPGWTFSTKMPLRDRQGKIIGIFGISKDISARKQAEERFHLVSNATNDVVWDWNLLTGEIWRNQNMQRLFGFQADQIGSTDGWWQTRIHPDEREKVVKSIHTAIDSDENFWSKEYRYQRADGSYIYVFDRGYIIHNDNGEPIRMIGAVMDITASKQAEEVLRQEAVHDPLTGLFNRRYMEEMLEREMLRSERNPQQPISIIMLDIDHFKQVNDRLGHAIGDAVLRQMGSFLLEHIRGSDIACRYGGDEFILILPNASLETAQKRAENIRTKIKDLIVAPYDKLLGELTLSLGVSAFPNQGSTSAEIFRAADAALYHAKEAGRNRVAVADTPGHTISQQ